MDYPSPNEARELSELLTDRFPANDGDAPLNTWLEVAGRLVASLTCREIGDAQGDNMEPVPADLEALAAQAIVMRTEAIVQRGSTSAARRKAISSGNLQSISAGPWSESYFGPDQAAQAFMLDPDPDLAALLWALATQDCRDDWVALWTGQRRPAAGVIAFEYSGRPGGGPRSVIGAGTEFL